ncbi:phosphonate ABC transporter substrate-binding protein [Opitutales bacterium ASA1]|nr:phosphonate ABC transporter substrate-binding protein [Opitutales bacterium ASA1]
MLRIGFTPTEDTLADREESTRALARYLEHRLGLRCEVVRTASYGPAVEALATGEIDLVALAPFAYVLAHRRGVAEAIALTAYADGQARSYSSVFVSKPEREVRTMDDLVRRASELRFSFTDRASNSGHLAPRAKLATLGLKPEEAFRSVSFTGSHAVALLDVAYGETDVAAVSASTLERLVASGRLRSEQFVELWRSDPMPNGPMAIRAQLPAALKAAVKDALAAMHRADPVASGRAMAGFSGGAAFFAPCDDETFSTVHALADAMPAEFTGPDVVEGGR